MFTKFISRDSCDKSIILYLFHRSKLKKNVTRQAHLRHKHETIS